jgi:uncharacterized repeat protein (TIGR02543 family)
MTAYPDSGWTFDGWSGDLTGMANPDTILMDSNKSVTVTFTQIPKYSLSVNIIGNGVVTVNGSSPYAAGSVVVMTAYPDSGWTFDGWSGDLTGMANPDTILMDSNKSVTVTFTQIRESYLVVRGSDDQIYYRLYNSGDGTWGSWVVLPGSTCDTPAAAVYDDKLYLVVRGIDGNTLWFGSVDLSDQSFSGWSQISGATPARPTLVCWENGKRLILVVKGTDNRIYQRQYDIAYGTWCGWNSLIPGCTCKSPAAAIDGDDLHLVVRGTDGCLYHLKFNLIVPIMPGWTKISGETPSGPTLTN